MQSRNQGCEALPRKFFAPLENCVGHNLKILDIVQRFWAPLGKLFAPPGVPSWLWACRCDFGKSSDNESRTILISSASFFSMTRQIFTLVITWTNGTCAFVFRLLSVSVAHITVEETTVWCALGRWRWKHDDSAPRSLDQAHHKLLICTRKMVVYEEKAYITQVTCL